VDVSTPDGRLTGLRFDSVVNCVNVGTLELSRVLRKLGEMSDALMLQVNEAMKKTLGIP